ncbi:hypothetical protein GCM10020256_65660 [Streptomyces thermocoprophilus]
MDIGTVRTPAAGEAADRRREQRGWYVYDWACSVYSTSVLTVFLGPYLTSVAKAAADADGYVHPLGVPVRAGSFFAYSVSLSVIVAVLLMPLVGAAADRSGRKKPLLAGGRVHGGPRRRRACSSSTGSGISSAGCCWWWRTRRSPWR